VRLEIFESLQVDEVKANPLNNNMAAEIEKICGVQTIQEEELTAADPKEQISEAMTHADGNNAEDE
jgi:hypothetical protein